MGLGIHNIVQGELGNNCYVISDGKGAYVIDPSYDGNVLKSYVANSGLELRGVLLTHFHLDHIDGALPFGDCRIFISKADHDILVSERAIEFMSDKFFGSGHMSQDECSRLRDFFTGSGIVTIGEGFIVPDFDLRINMIMTPGHSPGSVCYYCEDANAIFTGDTLFYHTYGRVDLPFSSRKSMMESLDRLSDFPEETAVYPGHGEVTTIGEETEYGFLRRKYD